ncbi:MAG: D-3-phosphoglycerate dehydrogenase / 2-oxoglutarate reductase, partial [Gaiellaceae bacterium]|nr:D-3-phosphoglycerate dehydrogenase / 2-oxoglutarate reductase [Gaiellaceae bacterium]
GLELRLDAAFLNRAPCLRAIATRTSQLRHIDLDLARERNIEVLRIDPAAPLLRATSSTAEETWALLLALVRNIPWAFDSVKAGRWERARYGGHELQGKTLGLVGFGRLGRMVARYGTAFDMRVLATDPKLAPGTTVDGVVAATLEELLAESDAVSLQCTYSEATRGLLGEAHFARMKPSALFVNTARGEITDEHALLRALEEGRIAGAAIDTLAGEGPDGEHLAGNALVEYARSHENLIVVPHLGGATVEATERTQLFISRELIAFLKRAG